MNGSNEKSSTHSNPECPFDATIQWCLIFDQPLSQVSINDETVCTLQGVVVWQDLSNFLVESNLNGNEQNQLCEVPEEDVSIGQRGISCTIGELRKGKVDARLFLEFTPENDIQNICREVAWNDIARVPLKPFLKALKNKIKNKMMNDTHIIRLDGLAKNTGYLSQRSLKYKAALAAARGVSLGDIPNNQVYNYLIREVVDKKEYVRYGSSAKVLLFNGTGQIVDSRTVRANWLGKM